MLKFEFRFDLAAILLASVLAAIGLATEDAPGSGDRRGGVSA
jgi:hypothetical protein